MDAEWIAWLLASVAAWPFIVLSIEALASLLPIRHRARGERVPCVVVIPAHNEEAGIGHTIANVRQQCRPGDRVLVVADNCTDGTAEAARRAGAEVSERTDTERRGKGFALAHGLQQLQAQPPAMVVIIDADCELDTGALDAIVEQAHATQQPAQGIYLIGTGAESDVRQRLSAFAVLFKNQVRPLGLHRLGAPCLLTGTGMAFPWHALQAVEVGSGNIVEDMKLGIDLAIAGYPPSLCPAARLSGAAAPDRGSAKQQRTRWEHGHLQTLLTQTPRLWVNGLLKGRGRLWALACEVSVPPLSFVALNWAIVLGICVMLWQQHWATATSVVFLTSTVIIFATSLLCSWLKYARRLISLWVILSVPLYIAWKIPIYAKLLFSRQKSWNRTKRSN